MESNWEQKITLTQDEFKMFRHSLACFMDVIKYSNMNVCKNIPSKILEKIERIPQEWKDNWNQLLDNSTLIKIDNIREGITIDNYAQFKKNYLRRF